MHAFLRKALKDADPQSLKVSSAFVDLDADGRLDALAYVSGRDLCGSGGCSLYVLRNEGRAYRIITRTTVTRPPIRVLQHRSHGWSDLGVWVAGGGIIPYEAVLRFDGKRYPGNPTTQTKSKVVPGSGKTVIADEAASTPL